MLQWDPPGSGMSQWIQWDAGVNNGNGVGLTNGGTFFVASHWEPTDLAPYNGMELSRIAFYPNGDPMLRSIYMFGPDLMQQIRY